MPESVGSVQTLWRYPVKSMLGEEIDASEVSERGLLGDRAYALIDAETGKLVSAKRPRLWGKLFDFQASFMEAPRAGAEMPAAVISLPDGAVVSTADPRADETLSAAIGRGVTLSSSAQPGAMIEEEWNEAKGPVAYGQRLPDDGDKAIIQSPAAFAAPGTFFDLSAVHFVTSASLNRLREVYPDGQVDARRFRPNIVIETPGSGFVENAWVGRTVAIGEQVRLSVMMAMIRCVMTTLPQGEGKLRSDPGILKALAQHNRINVMNLGELPCIGMAAGVVQGGTVHVGDSVRLE